MFQAIEELKIGADQLISKAKLLAEENRELREKLNKRDKEYNELFSEFEAARGELANLKRKYADRGGKRA